MLSPDQLVSLLINPAAITSALDLSGALVVFKWLVVAVAVLYFLYMFVILIQIIRLERWLLILRRYHLSWVMMVQIMMVGMGVIGAIFLL